MGLCVQRLFPLSAFKTNFPIPVMNATRDAYYTRITCDGGARRPGLAWTGCLERRSEFPCVVGPRRWHGVSLPRLEGLRVAAYDDGTHRLAEPGGLQPNAACRGQQDRRRRGRTGILPTHGCPAPKCGWLSRGAFSQGAFDPFSRAHGERSEGRKRRPPSPPCSDTRPGSVHHRLLPVPARTSILLHWVACALRAGIGGHIRGGEGCREGKRCSRRVIFAVCLARPHDRLTRPRPTPGCPGEGPSAGLAGPSVGLCGCWSRRIIFEYRHSHINDCHCHCHCRIHFIFSCHFRNDAGHVSG